ncbi:DUF2059 domain-containing protein [Moraxella osloensis]|uniref:DUF2059 domain-containing protein n=1 Tax=Faucicola osloensis TaxID=34062 RepID=A0A6P1KDC4_FAUOS|nr:DUF2059 domain-containing protein [Moraxella osloensis]QHG08840.1 DUF2059 domain-containing protein [Moraxella osloensis]
MKLLKMAVFMGCLSILSFSPVTQAKLTVVAGPLAYPANQIPSDESLKKLVQVQQMDKTFSEMMEQSKGVVTQTVQNAIKDNLKDQKLSETQQQQIQQVVNDFMQKSLEAQNQPKMREQFINAFIETAKTTYTQAEVNSMIDFYGSTVGQSVIAKQSQFGKAYLEKIMPIVMENQQQTLQELMPAFKQKLEKIVQPNQKTTKKANSKIGKK